VKNCGGSLYGSSGSLLSPNYPNGYANNLYCEWLITVPPDSPGGITLVIESLALESNNDRLFILASSSQQDGCNPLGGRPYWTGQVAGPMTIPTRLPTLGLYFYSDSLITAPGFNVTWYVRNVNV
jgi:hypothetical protein